MWERRCHAMQVSQSAHHSQPLPPLAFIAWLPLCVCASLLSPSHQNTSWLLRADCSKNCFNVGVERAVNHLHRWRSWQCRRWLLSLAIGCQFAQARRDSPLCLLCAFHVESRCFGAANDVIGLLTERCLCLFIIPLIYNVSAWTHFGGNIG